MNGYRVFSINKDRFPNMKQLSDDLNERGIKLIATINPAVKFDQDFDTFNEGFHDDLFCKRPGNNLLKGISWPGWVVFPE
jgi:alpha-glucosidase